VFERQAHHLVLLALLLAGLFLLLDPAALAGRYLGLPTGSWLALAIADPIIHQVYVWLVWRSELLHSAVSRRLGRRRGFALYAFGFIVLALLRPALIILLAVSNRNTLRLAPAIADALALVFAALSLYLFYSVACYFGLERAFGIDHFDPAYRNQPFVRQGIFRFTRNGMYTVGFLALWLPGLLWFSKAALLAALFGHLYIWVHYYCTELPDIRRIYSI
jgi:hypothetical protein